MPSVTAGLRRWLGVDRLERAVTDQQEHLDQLAVAHHETRMLAAGEAAPHGSPEAAYRAEAIRIERRHDAQTAEGIKELRSRYEDPIFGEVPVWSLVEKLAQCIDPSDCRLFGVSQQVHVLQMIEAMEADGVLTDELLLVALVHDLGKVLLLTDEDPANIVAMNRPVGEHPDGVGLDRCTLQWNHDELAWSRLHEHVPDHVAWLIRYHSIDIDACTSLMDERDREYTERHLRPFSHYDHDFKSPFARPTTTIATYRDVVEDAFPRPIRF